MEYTQHNLANGDVRLFWPETCDVLTIDKMLISLASDQDAYVAKQAAEFAATATTNRSI